MQRRCPRNQGGHHQRRPHRPSWRTFHVGSERDGVEGGMGKVGGFVWLQEALLQERIRQASLTDGLLEV